LNTEKQKIGNCIARLIDSYAEGVIEKSEFEPRVKSYKKRLFNIEQQLFQSLDNKNQQSELQLLIGKIETFSTSVKHKLEDVDWQMKRDIFEALIKQVEIEHEKVNVVFRVSPYLPGSPHGNNKTRLLEDCRTSGNSSITNFHTSIPCYLCCKLYRKRIDFCT